MKSAMRRGDFENLLRRLLDKELNPRGFALTPQAPADFIGEKQAAVYEANPDQFGERYPALDQRATGNTICVDLWFHFDESTGSVTSDLDGTSLDALLNRFHLRRPGEVAESSSDLETQVSALLSQVVAILDAAQA
jgi:hypothetical protein